MMPRTLSSNSAGVNRSRAYAVRFMAPVEFDREQDIGRLRAPIGDERLIGRALEIGIVEVDVGIAVAGGGDVHEPSARCDQCSDAINQYEMA